MPLLPRPIAITAAAARSALGHDLESHYQSITAGRSGLRPLKDYPGAKLAAYADLHAGWLEERTILRSRRYGAASQLAVTLAAEALQQSGWTAAERREAWLFAGTSRGNVGELLDEHQGRRPHGIYAASNTLHSEIAAAVSIEHGIHGAWQTLANGCAAGLDAAGMAAWAVATGMAPRALVVSVELPLLPRLLADFTRSGLLSQNGVNAPYAPHTTGFMPAEAAAALTLEPISKGTCITGCWWNSDAYDPVALPPDGKALRELLRTALTETEATSVALCPHATGTAAHGKVEAEALAALLPEQHSVHLLKPYTGHSLGASGALDLAILWRFMQAGLLPPNLPGSTDAPAPLHLPTHFHSNKDVTLFKLSSGMGGHNALLGLMTYD